jgi:photosystem II stability/assembly factor-like uncharacterized protein
MNTSHLAGKSVVYLSLSVLLIAFFLIPAMGVGGAVLADTGWQQQSSGTTVPLHEVSAVDASTAWAVGDLETVLKTTDGGATWTPQQVGAPTALSVRYVSAVNQDVAWVTFLSNGEPAYKTVDGGNNWQPAFTPGPNENCAGISAVDANTAYLMVVSHLRVGDYSLDHPSILKTTDGGGTWSTQYVGPASASYGGGGPTEGPVWALDANTAWAYYRGILKTTDGTNWTKQSSSISPSSISAIDANNLWGADGGTIYRTNDGGGSWAPVPNQPGLGGIYGISASSVNVAVAVGATSGGYLDPNMRGVIYRTTDGGTSWSQQASALLPMLNSVFAVDNNTAWAVGMQGTILKTTDGGGVGHPVPVLKSITPLVASVGDEVVLKGSSFGASQGSSHVYFLPVAGVPPPHEATDFTLWSDTEIRCRVPQTDLGPTLVIITGDLVMSNILAGFVVVPPGGYPAPTVTSINPAQGVDDTTISITDLEGTGFLSGATVRLEQGSTVINATGVTVVSDTKITCTLKPSAAPLGKYDVIVKNYDGQEGRLAGGFSVTNVCGGGGAISLSVFGIMMGLLSLAGSTGLRRRLGMRSS